MVLQTAAVDAGAEADASAPAVGSRGRITVAERVYTRLAEAAVADQIGVARGQASVAVSQYGDGFILRVRTPLPVPSLDDPAAIAAGEPVLERVTAMQQALQDRLGYLFGRDIRRVDVTVTGAVIARQKRVK